MVSGMYMTAGQDIIGRQKNIQEMEEVAKASKTHYRQPQDTAKKVIVHNPEKNPLAPLYRPDREVLFKQDRFHFAPPQNIGGERPVKELKFAAGADGVPPENNPSNFNVNKIKNVDNQIKNPDFKNNNTYSKK